ncbi:MAG TPA: hypothetical protein VEY14_00425 [Nocardioidaceae bacterium]|nr:hypothetical protein [Nocardioidaceae bacterium]
MEDGAADGLVGGDGEAAAHAVSCDPVRRVAVADILDFQLRRSAAQGIISM